MPEITYEPCRCGCQPIVLTGCGCKVCILGKLPHRRTLSEVLGAAGVDSCQPNYCPKCNLIVFVLSVERGDHWVHICKPHAHGWRTESRI